MHVSDILDRKGRTVVTVPQATPVTGLARLLRMEHIGAAVVVAGADSIIGIVSERDIVHHIADDPEGLLRDTVADIMSTPVVTCGPDDDIKDVMAVMTRRRVRHLPVVDRGRLAGIISIGDVVKYRIEENTLEINVLRDVARAHGAAGPGEH